MSESRIINIKAINGKLYLSARDAYNCLSPQMSYNTFASRYKQDLPYQELMKPSLQAKKRETLVIDNVHYKSVRDAYDKLKPSITKGTFYKRIQSGERRLSILLKPIPRTKEILVDGFLYDNIKEAYDDIQPPVSLQIFRRRIYDGYSMDQLMEPKNNNAGKRRKHKND